MNDFLTRGRCIIKCKGDKLNHTISINTFMLGLGIICLYMLFKVLVAFPVVAAGLRGEWPSPLPAMACARPLISVYSEKGEN